jgi:hypothetical protein
MERGKRTAREEIGWKKRRHATHTTTPSRCYTCYPHFGGSPNKPQRQEEEKNAQSRTHCTALMISGTFETKKRNFWIRVSTGFRKPFCVSQMECKLVHKLEQIWEFLLRQLRLLGKRRQAFEQGNRIRSPSLQALSIAAADRRRKFLTSVWTGI